MSILSVVDHGAKGNGITDDTAAIQATINAAKAGDTVYAPTGTYMINALVGNDNYASGGIFLKSNTILSLAPGAVLKEIPNASPHSVVVTIKGCENVTIAGPGSILGDRDKHVDNPPATSQWGHGISIWGNCRNLVVQNLTIAKCWGDGIAIGSGTQITIDRVTTDSCRRQNMSVGAVDQLKITNCTFKNAEMSGLDLECDLDNQTISNVLVQYCSFVGSGGPAHIGVGSTAGTYKGIVIKDCQFDLKMQPIFAHDNAGSTGTPWWAFLYNRIFYEGLHSPTYRFVGYPTSWSSK